MPLSEILINHKQTVRGRTMQILEKVPQDKLNWRPMPEVLTLGQLIYHMGQADMAWRKVLEGAWSIEGFLAMRRNMDLMDVIGELDSLTDEIRTLEIMHEEFLKWLAAQSDEELERVYEAGEWRLKAYEIVLGLCEHESHHRGQIVTYLRLLGVEQPQPWGL